MIPASKQFIDKNSKHSTTIRNKRNNGKDGSELNLNFIK